MLEIIFNYYIVIGLTIGIAAFVLHNPSKENPIGAFLAFIMHLLFWVAVVPLQYIKNRKEQDAKHERLFQTASRILES